MRFRDLYTVFYSTILASAAVADSKRKDTRRREWEKLIRQAREELKAIEDQQSSRLARLSPDSGTDIPQSSDTNTWEGLFQWAKQMSNDRGALGLQDVPGPPLSLLQELKTSEIQELLSHSVLASLREPLDGNTESQKWGVIPENKDKILAWSVRKLAYRLLKSSMKDNSGLSTSKGEEQGTEHGVKYTAIGQSKEGLMLENEESHNVSSNRIDDSLARGPPSGIRRKSSSGAHLEVDEGKIYEISQSRWFNGHLQYRCRHFKKQRGKFRRNKGWRWYNADDTLISKAADKVALFYERNPSKARLDEPTLIPAIESGDPDLQRLITECIEKVYSLQSESSRHMESQGIEYPTQPLYRNGEDRTTKFVNLFSHRLVKRIMRSSYGRDRKNQEILSTTAQILLNSQTPPDIRFFNPLIGWLVRNQRWDDVKTVLDSMRECEIKPNRITLNLVLRYYAGTGDRRGFQNITQRMQRLRQRLTMGYAMATNNDLGTSQNTVCMGQEAESYQVVMNEWLLSRYSEVESMQCNDGAHVGTEALLDSSQWVALMSTRVRMNCMDFDVYRSLIDGVISFNFGLKQLMTYYKQMVQDGWEPNDQLLQRILDYCVRLNNWEAGVAVWNRICCLAEGVSQAAISTMLSLCRSCDMHIAFGKVLDYGVRVGLLPDTVWNDPEKVARGEKECFLDPNGESTLTENKFRAVESELERPVEHLGYRIASTALDIAGLDLGALESNTGFDVYLKIRKIHTNSPGTLLHWNKKLAFRGLVKCAMRKRRDSAWRRDHQIKRLDIEQPLLPDELKSDISSGKDPPPSIFADYLSPDRPRIRRIPLQDDLPLVRRVFRNYQLTPLAPWERKAEAIERHLGSSLSSSEHASANASEPSTCSTPDCTDTTEHLQASEAVHPRSNVEPPQSFEPKESLVDVDELCEPPSAEQQNSNNPSKFTLPVDPRYRKLRDLQSWQTVFDINSQVGARA